MIRIFEQEGRRTMDKKIYDVIIVGGGPGGYTAALYATRAGLSTLILEKMAVGGQMAATSVIDNYPGFDEGIDGFSLGEKMKAGAEKFGAETVFAEVTGSLLEGNVKEIQTTEGTFYSKTVIIATGASPRKLGLEEEDKLVGRGVGYCAVCDGMFYRGKDVVVVGGGNSAVEDAIYLSRICNKVRLVHRRDTFRASRIYQDELLNIENIELILDSEVKEILYDDKVKGVRVFNNKTGEASIIDTDGVFISIGRQPISDIWKGQVEMDEVGYIIADETTRTNVPGVFAVGDVRTKALRQVVTAASDGAVAAHFAEEYIK